jgi:hypothetical protein
MQLNIFKHVGVGLDRNIILASNGNRVVATVGVASVGALCAVVAAAGAAT